MSLKDLLVSAKTLTEISAFLNGLSDGERLLQALTLGGSSQAKLFDLAQGFQKLNLEDMVPTGTPPMTKVTHEGRNSLPAFSGFAKVFYRPSDNTLSELWGYNRTSGFVTSVVGPGYYVASVVNGEILIDYTKAPKEPCPQGPAYVRNGERLSRFVYFDMQDTLRGVSKHVSIGRATRHGKLQNNWFILCRTHS
jgi:hypothetical protein